MRACTTRRSTTRRIEHRGADKRLRRRRPARRRKGAQGIRRSRRLERHRFHDPAPVRRLTHRSERRRQDDVLQHAHGCLQADRGPHRVRRRRRDGQAAARDHRARRREDVPEHPPVPEHDRARERPRWHALAVERGDPWLDPPHAGYSQGRGGSSRTRAGAASVLRPPEHGRRNRTQPLVRRPAPARGCPGACDEAEAAAARRADGGDEPAGDVGVHGLRRETPQRRGPDGAPDRARHARRHEHLRPCHCPRLRREDRRGDAAGGAARLARYRGVSREAGVGRKRRLVSAAAPATAPASGNVLELEDVHTFYGSIEALKGISIDVKEGEIVTLIGANGAGKSTTLRSINGLNNPRRGRIRFQGRDITNASAHEIVSRGISQSPEGRRLFPRMSVLENLLMGTFQREDRNNRKAVNADLDRVYSLFPRLSERKQQKAGTLSGGEQQMVAIGRALMAHPKLLLLDEPSMGLAPIFVERIFEIIREINGQGTPILLVEQNALMALDIANRGYVLETGSVALADDAKKLKQNEDVKKTYLGVTD